MMKKTIFAATCVALTAVTANAYADDDAAITTGAGGAVTGAIVGGPVGAVVGGVVGFTAGAAIDPPPREVVTYVEEQPVPTRTVVVQEPVVVGEPLPEQVLIEEVPDSDGYAYGFVNDQRVIIDPETRTVVEVVE
jgi:hypothetical protein